VTIPHISDEERAAHDRGTGNRGRGRVEFVRLRERGIDVLAVVPPREPVVLDEMSVTPSKRWQKQEATKEAKRALAQVKKGKSFSDGYLKTLQQRLLTVERQEALSGRESEGRQLATALGETRRAKVVTEALDVLARPKETRRFSDAYLNRLQQRLLGIERQDELLGRESEGGRLAEQLGDVRRSRLVAEAADVLSRAKEGRRYSNVYLTKLQQRLLSMEQQDEVRGAESEGRHLANVLGEVRRSRLIAEAMNVLARAKEGRRFSADYLNRLQQLLVSMERQNALSGEDSEGLRLAVALAALRR
jgi:hypothetical protein